MLNLLAKDFKVLLGGNDNKKSKILSAIFVAFVYLAIVVIETFIFRTILKKIEIYNNATIPFLVLYLSMISLVNIVLNTTRAKKYLFNKKDIEQLTRYPIPTEKILGSKMIFLFLMSYITELVLTLPVLIVYGNITGQTMLFYYLLIFYPVLSFIFEIGVAFILVYPYKMVIDYMKKHLVVQCIVAFVLMFGFCFVYANVVEIFIEIVGGNDLEKTLNNFIPIAIKLKDNLVPINFLADMFITLRSNMLFSYLTISFGVLMLGLLTAYIGFNYFRKVTINPPFKPQKEKVKVTTIKKALLKKEITILFKDSNNLLSFSGLLIIQPYLLYLIIKCINNVFNSGALQYYMSMYPQLIAIVDILIIMLFTVIINSGANEYIQNEKKTLRIMKTIPVPPFEQLMIKVLVPYVSSLISLIFSLIILLITNTLSFETVIFGMLLSVFLLTIFEMVSLREELKIRNNKPKSTLISSLIAYLFPLVFMFTAVFASLMGLNVIWSYILSIVALGLISIPYVYRFKEKTIALYEELEVVN